MEAKNIGLDFSDTQIAYAHKSDKELKETYRLFKLMNNPSLVKLGSSLGLTAVKFRLPFAKAAVKKTIFSQFVAGESLLDSQKVISHLFDNNTQTILDYGAEGKSSDEELDNVRDETIKAIKLAASNNSVPAVSTKITGLAKNELLEKLNKDEELNAQEKNDYDKLVQRLDAISKQAYDLGVSVLVDAEESWMQIAMDRLVDEMMEAYNKDRVTVWNTFQLYRKDKLDFLMESHDKARSRKYMLGAKLVRGAYMDKEGNRAREMGYENPIQNSKEDTDRDYNKSLEYCVEHYKTIASVCASHNLKSNLYQAQLIEENGIDKKNPHLNFCQLFGMSDNITFNLANAGYNVAKYLVYGPVKEVLPYLVRRAKENSSVTGDMSRELKLVHDEMKRRGL